MPIDGDDAAILEQPQRGEGMGQLHRAIEHDVPRGRGTVGVDHHPAHVDELHVEPSAGKCSDEHLLLDPHS